MKIFCILWSLGFASICLSAEPQLDYLANVQIKQYDAKKFPESKTVLVLKDVPLTLAQVGPKPGIWSGIHRIDERFYIEARLIDFGALGNDKSLRLDVQLSYLHDVTSGGAATQVGIALCETRSRYEDAAGLKILERAAV
jgi:hypothetical protein